MEKKFKLDELKKTEPFQTPDGYFDSFSDKVKVKLHQRRNSGAPDKVVPMSTYRAIAASVIGILFLTWFAYLTFSPTEQSAENLLAEVSHEDLAAYLYNDEFEIEDLTSFTDEDFFIYTPESIDNALELLDDAQVDDLYNDFQISKEDTL